MFEPTHKIIKSELKGTLVFKHPLGGWYDELGALYQVTDDFVAPIYQTANELKIAELKSEIAQKDARIATLKRINDALMAEILR